jgi:hypothetical protein
VKSALSIKYMLFADGVLGFWGFGVLGVGVVYHTLAEPEGYLLHVILSGA